MRRGLAIAGSAGFFLLAPGTVAGLVPWMITGWRVPKDALLPLLFAGDAVVLVGLAVLVWCFAQFAWQGGGTPAPPAPTERLVVEGLYRFVRNPMYLAVMALLIGQAMIFASVPMLVYAALIAPAFHLFVTQYEEPRLHATYPHQYPAYMAAVPRWIPRMRPWKGPRDGISSDPNRL